MRSNGIRKGWRFSRAYALIWNNLGMVQFVQGRTIEAIADFEKALEIQPKLADAHNNLGAALKFLPEVRQGAVPPPQGSGAPTRIGRCPLQPGHCFDRQEAIQRGDLRIRKGAGHPARPR